MRCPHCNNYQYTTVKESQTPAVDEHVECKFYCICNSCLKKFMITEFYVLDDYWTDDKWDAP